RDVARVVVDHDIQQTAWPGQPADFDIGRVAADSRTRLCAGGSYFPLQQCRHGHLRFLYVLTEDLRARQDRAACAEVVSDDCGAPVLIGRQGLAAAELQLVPEEVYLRLAVRAAN